MITVQPPLDLPPYNEVVVIKVRLDNGHIKYRTDARDRPAFRREFRTFRYDDHGFLLNTRHEAHSIRKNSWLTKTADDNFKPRMNTNLH